MLWPPEPKKKKQKRGGAGSGRQKRQEGRKGVRQRQGGHEVEGQVRGAVASRPEEQAGARKKSPPLKAAAVDHEQLARWSVATVVSATGIVYGDIGTSPLYALEQSLMPRGTFDSEAVLGALSLIFWASRSRSPSST